MRWVQSGACRSVAPEVFFPEGWAAEIKGEVEVAKAVCRACCVAAECADWAIATDQVHGIWGGLTRRERILRSRRESLRPTA